MDYSKIHKADSVKSLKNAIIEIFGEDGIIKGRTQDWTVKKMLEMIDTFPLWLPTREYGIRQQLIMILYYENKL